MSNILKKKIIDGVKKGKSFFVTGAAGVGKTHLIKEIYEQLKKDGANVALTSTTGINALNLGGITVHKFFGLTNRTDMGYLGFMKSSFLFRGISMRLAQIDVIIIDEVSMLRADTLELINAICQQALKNTLPFGGKSIIFTGDFYQIAPVVKNYEKKKTQWIFESPVWLNANIEVIVMEKIYRQTDPVFIEFLQNIRIGKFTKNMDGTLNICESNKLSKDTTIFFATNEECEKWNQTKMDQIKGKETIYEAEIHGKRNKKYAHDKESITRDCIAKQILGLKVGARVIAVTNDNKRSEYVNGSLGYVTECVNVKGSKYVEVLFENNKKPTVVRPHTWTKLNLKGKKVATMKQIPLIPAYALTIHKSQGLTLDSAIVDCKNIFVSGQLYVALSRVRTMTGLKIINFKKSQILVNENVKKFYESLQ